MPNSPISTIRSSLSTKLGEVSQLKSVAIGRTFDFSAGFPACRHYLVGIASEPVDNMPSDYRTYQFAIDVVQQQTAQAVATAEANFQDAIDAVLDKLNAEWDLGGVDNSVIEQTPVTHEDGPQGPTLYCSILFQAKVLIY